MEKEKLKTDLKKRAYQFSISIIRFIDILELKRIYNPIIDQLLRSATSVRANIVEAKSASSKRDFIKYFEIALKSCNETKYWLCLIRDSFHPEQTETTKLITEADEISKIIASSVLTLKGQKPI